MSTRVTELVQKISGDAKQLIAEVERAKTANKNLAASGKQAGEESSRGLDKMATSSKKAANAVGNTVDALGDLRTRGSAAFNDLARQGAEFAALMGPGGAIVGAAGVATIAIVSVFLRTKSELKALRQAFDEELRAMTRANDLAGLSKLQQQFYSGDRDFGNAGGEEERGNRALRARNIAVRAGGLQGAPARLEQEEAKLKQLAGAEIAARSAQARAVKELRDGIAILNDEYARLRPRVESVTAATVGLTTETLKQEKAEERRKKAQQASEQSANRLATALSALIDGTRALQTELAGGKSQDNQIETFFARLSAEGIDLRGVIARIAELRTVIDAGGDAGGKAAKEIDELTKKYQKYITALEQRNDVQTAWELKEAAAKSKDRAIKGLEAANDAITRRNQLLDNQREREDQLSRDRQRELLDLEAEVKALRAGTAAYEVYLKQRAIAAEIAKDEKAKGSKLDEHEILLATSRAEAFVSRLFAAQKELARLREASGDPLLQQFTALAEQALQIATALGEGRGDLGKMAAFLAPLLSGVGGLSKALAKVGPDGQPITRVTESGERITEQVSLLSALGGKNGKEAQAQALASSLAIAGVFAGILDAIDIFGTKAEAERRRLRELAREWARALEDFVLQANPQGIFAERQRQLRRQAEDLAKQAAAANNATATFDGEVTAERLRELAAWFQAEAAANEKMSQSLAKNLRGTAQGFLDLAEALEANEAAARRQVQAQIRDLKARQLAAAGLTEEAARLREKNELDAASAQLAAAKLDIDKEYAQLLVDVIAAENALNEAMRVRTAILRTLDDTLSVLGLEGPEALAEIVRAVSQLSPQIADALAGLDLSTKAGLEEARSRLRALFLSLSEDGISEAEQPLVELIQRVLGGIGDMLDTLADGIQDRLEAFEVKRDVFGLTLQQQLTELAAIYGEAFDLDAVLGDASLSSEEARAGLQARIQAAIDEILADGIITDAERPYLEVLRTILGVVNSAIDEATQAAQQIAEEAKQAAADAEAARAKAVQDRRAKGNADVDFFDLDGADAVRTRLASFGTSFADMFAAFDLDSREGIDAATSLLTEFRAAMAQMSDEKLLQKFGLTRDELNDAIATFESDLDGLAEAMDAAADAAKEQAAALRSLEDALAVDLLRLQGDELGADLLALQQQLEEDLAEAIAAGASEETLGKIRERAALRRAQIEREFRDAQARANPTGSASSTTTERARRGSATVVGDFGGLSEVTGQSLAGRLQEIALNTSSRGPIVGAILGALRPIGPIPVPSLSSTSTAGSGGLVLQINSINITLDPQGLSPQAAAQATAQQIAAEVRRELGQAVRADTRFLGPGRRMRGRS